MFKLRLKRIFGWNENSFELRRVTNGKKIDVVLQITEETKFIDSWEDVPIDETIN